MTTTPRYAEGIQINAPITSEFAEILTPEAMDFVAKLIRTFAGRREELRDKWHTCDSRRHPPSRSIRARLSDLPATSKAQSGGAATDTPNGSIARISVSRCRSDAQAHA